MAMTNEKKETGTKERTTSKSTACQAGNTDDIQRPKLDFGDLRSEWARLINKKRQGAESNLLRITCRINKLDPVAEVALGRVKKKFSTDEIALRKRISTKGWATELDRVNKRINGIRVSENKRLILAEVYPAILDTLLKCEEADEAIKDEIGFANDVFFELEREDGPLDMFSREVVKLVGSKHRISFTDDNVLRDLVAHQVRAGL